MKIGVAISVLLLALDGGLSLAELPEVQLIKAIVVPGNLLDQSGLRESLGAEIWQDMFGGVSGLDYLGHDDLYLAVSDRGPRDGEVDWTCRTHVVRISLTPEPICGGRAVAGDNTAGEFTVLKTTLLQNGERPYSGYARRIKSDDRRLRRLDPEAVRVGRDGRFFIADEYGPYVIEFDRAGQEIRALPLPQRYQVGRPAESKDLENAANSTGRQSNRGLEGLAMSVDRNYLFGLFQSPLLQDCRRDGKGQLTGRNCRLFSLDVQSLACREYLYRLDSNDNKLNEILFFDEQKFLVIERDGEQGAKATYKKIILADLAAASEIQAVDALPPDRVPAGVVPVNKQVFIDLLDPRFGLAGDSMPEKLESLAFGPTLPDGRRTLLLASDNDFQREQPTWFYCFAIGKPRLGNDGSRTTSNQAE